MKSAATLACLLVVLRYATSESEDDAVLKWTTLANRDLQATLKKFESFSARKAKNLVLFVGDGMGVSTVSVARALKAHLQGKLVGEEVIAFEKLPFTTLSKTYDADKAVPDSAATATALWCGVKTTDGTIGVDERVKFGNCSTYKPHSDLKCMSHYAKEAGMATAIVTTTAVTHATPSPGYAHSPHRDWETQQSGKPRSANSACKDIATQFVELGDHIDVLLGGGSNYFSAQVRSDKRDLAGEWLAKRKRDASKKPLHVTTKAQLLEATQQGATDLLGLFAPEYLAWGAGKNDTTRLTQPTLAEMVESALEILQKNDKGFLLFVEGGQIDWGHHVNMAGSALEEVFGMEEAFKVVERKVSLSDTLVVVTADHSHAFSFGGYPSRSANVLDKAEEMALDNMPYTYLHYANGPSALVNAPRANISAVNTTVMDYRQQALVRLKSETHGGEDVPIYAGGPMAHLFTNVQEQHSIPHYMMFASCLGPWRSNSNRDCPVASSGQRTLITLHFPSYLTAAICVCTALALYSF